MPSCIKRQSLYSTSSLRVGPSFDVLLTLNNFLCLVLPFALLHTHPCTLPLNPDWKQSLAV